jgi:hypothetical protein
MLASDPGEMNAQSGPLHFSPDGTTILYTKDFGLWSM